MKQVPGPSIEYDMKIKFPPQFKQLLKIYARMKIISGLM